MRYFLLTLMLPLAIAMLSGCADGNKKGEGVFRPLLGNATIFADTITYDVVLRALDDDNIWEIEQLKYVDHQKLIGFIFDGIYSNRYEAFDFYNGQKLSSGDVQKLEQEEGYDRNRVSKLQFRELWYADTLGVLHKEIYSITLGIEAYSNQNNFLGHRALFTARLR